MKVEMMITHPAFALFAFACFALAPSAKAVCQDGCLANHNTALGTDVLSVTTGVENTAMGLFALTINTTGSQNTATGSVALANNTTGNNNTAVGFAALQNNATGNDNTADGYLALASNNTGTHNTGVGYQALLTNDTNDNTAVGWSALAASTGTNSGGEGGNTAVGSQALLSNTSGVGNTALGWFALLTNTGSDNNTAVGAGALSGNTGSGNTALGTNAGGALTTGFANIDIGDSVVGVAGESNTIRIGLQGTQTATFIAGIRGTPITGAVAVGVNSSGQLGVRPSSARFKEAIQPMNEASEAILALKPVTFRYKKELDPKRAPQFGLVAEEVAKVNPDLVVADDHGKPFTVRYEEVNAMLLNEFLKEHRTVQAQQKEIDALRAELKEQRALIQKVNDKVELNKAAPQTVLNNQ